MSIIIERINLVILDFTKNSAFADINMIRNFILDFML